MKKIIVLAVFAVLIAMVFLSGCTQNTEKPALVADYKTIAKNEVESKYAWEITQIKSEMYREGMSDESIDNETNIELAGMTKEDILKNAKDYELTQDEIDEIQNSSPEEFMQFKEDYLKSGVREYIKGLMKESLDEITAEFNFSVKDVKSKKEIPDMDTYLGSFGLDDETVQKTKKKAEKGEYIVVVELNIEETVIIPEVCDSRGEIIGEE